MTASAPSDEPADSADALHLAGEAMRAAGVRYLYLVHGTFAGNDALGIFSELGRYVPQFGQWLRATGKQVFDALAGDVGNYSEEFCAALQEGLNSAGPSPRGRGGGEGSHDGEHNTHSPHPSPLPEGEGIYVRRFNWSSENHHIGRAHGAIQLLDELLNLDLQPGERVCLWGHSHAGNVFALLSNLLAADGESRDKFFEQAQAFYRWPLLGRVDVPLWTEMADRLAEDGNPFSPSPLGRGGGEGSNDGKHNVHSPHANPLPEGEGIPLDFVTFGTPIRYGWDPAGYGRLLHVVNHRPCDGHPKHLAVFPPKFGDVTAAASGDFVQQLGIAGTDFPPGIFSWRSWLAERKLARFLQGDLRRRDTIQRWKHGQRVPAEGRTVLVDYGDCDEPIREHLAGHGVYTRMRWLQFHAKLVAEQVYSTKATPTEKELAG